MKQKRRDFFKTLGIGSVAFTIFPANQFPPAFSQTESITKHDLKKFTQQNLETEVLVAGGGLSGVCAAIVAARNGAKVIFIQDRSRLGGNASSEIRMHVLGANNHEATRNWRETGIIEELKLTEAALNPQRSFEYWDLILYDKVISEPNITLLLDTAVIDATVENEQIVSIQAMSPLLEEYYQISARFFIDCTGDATLAALAGAHYMQGREGTEVFGESLAAAETDNKTMGNSIMFFARKHDRPMPFIKPAWARTFTKDDFKHRAISSYEYGYWWIEWGGELDTIKDNRKIRHELLKVVLGIWDYIKNSGEHPDSANWALDWVGMIPGKRESRRIIGDHIMIQQEMERAELYFDRIAYGGWPMDDHPPCGIDCTQIAPYRSIKFQQPYHIPLRSLFSKNRPNLLMAGRNISASHVAFSSTRVMATCATMGQAAGLAAAFCLQKNYLPAEIVKERNQLSNFQQFALKDDQSVLGIQNEDPVDLARKAKITASSETADGLSISVIDGWNRNIADGKSHQWQAHITGTPPWIELKWPKSQIIRTIQLTFDTGLHRRLYLSGKDGEYFSQIRGPQPETVADFIVEAKTNGKLTKVVEIRDNFLRLVRLNFAPVKTDSLRITILRTNGDELARVFEVRCYA
ncbi:FAD-dependent oxidoreductase [candidate division KSB1 bacterium]|nr:FAD-dependent oxidoreductase [candidate division KSB1 bacterium]